MSTNLLKKKFLLGVLLSISFSFDQAVFAGQDGEESSVEQTTTKEEQTASLSITDFMQTMTIMGSVWGSLKILGEYKQFATDYVRPFCVGVHGIYSSGQNPFACPLHICHGIDRICEMYSLSERGCKNLRDFASPIISQLCQALRDNGGVLPYDFAFSKNTVRSLYFRGEAGSGKSRLVMEELPKVFLKDPKDAIIITNGKGFSESEDIINALLGIPQYNLGMGVSLIKQRNLGEKIKANAGRGIVVFDDYTKYNTPALDKCVLSLHDEGKLNTPQGEINCQALLFFFSSDETDEEFFISPEQEVEKIIHSRLLSSSGETIPEKTIVRRVGHPEGFVRKIRFVSLTRLNGEFLKDILNNYFLTKVLPITWKNAKVELSYAMLNQLVSINEFHSDNAQQVFDMTSIQTALLDFRREFNFRSQERPDLIIDYEDYKVRARFKNPDDEYQRNLEYTGEELDLDPLQRIGCFRSFCRRHGISSLFSGLYNGFFSCFCNKENPEEEFYPITESDENSSQNADYNRNPYLRIAKSEGFINRRTVLQSEVRTQINSQEQFLNLDDISKTPTQELEKERVDDTPPQPFIRSTKSAVFSTESLLIPFIRPSKSEMSELLIENTED
jgi:hypothetical protein